jgi:hypothetical protein
MAIVRHHATIGEQDGREDPALHSIGRVNAEAIGRVVIAGPQMGAGDMPLLPPGEGGRAAVG